MQLYQFTTIAKSPISVNMLTEIESQLTFHCAAVKPFIGMQAEAWE